MTDPRRALPSMDRLLQEPAAHPLVAAHGRAPVAHALRALLDQCRAARAPWPADWAARAAAALEVAALPSLRPVLNATGVVLHTNLGRAPLAAAAIEAMVAVAGGYAALEFDLARGERGSRHVHARARLAALAGAEDALVVNNAAGALVLALNAAAEGLPVAISRGELVEIGGSFRIPDIMAKSGARLLEVGTTNRTHLADYEAALDAGARAILTVHRSNFRLEGFVATPAPAELAALARARGVPYLYDVGSGLLADLSAHGLRDEPRVQEGTAAGADLVLFSGDKLLGGPQAGCIVGSGAWVARCRANPLARALRADKLTLAALEATLALYDDPARARREIPVLRMLTLDEPALRARAEALAAACAAHLPARVVPGEGTVGGGAFPASRLPTSLVALDPGALGADELARRLRTGRPPLVARVADGAVLLDPRTLPDDTTPLVADLVAAALRG